MSEAEELNELTVDGMIQEKTLGEYLHKKYSNESEILMDTCDEQKFRIRSLGQQRSILSAWSVMAGLFPEPEGPKKSREYPIEVEWEDEDILLRGFDIWYEHF